MNYIRRHENELDKQDMKMNYIRRHENELDKQDMKILHCSSAYGEG